jgi:glycogen debranching enzyme
MSERRESPDRHVSPLGEEFEVAGRAGPVELMGAPPIPAEARADLLVIKAGRLFLCARPDGDIRPPAVSGEGLYADDTRYLSELRLSFGATQPIRLAHSVEFGYRAEVNATNPAMADALGSSVPQETINLRRTLLIADRLYCSVALHNFHQQPVTLPLTLSLGADFADVFEIRGVRRRAARGRAMVPKAGAASAVFGYEGEDGIFRETIVELDPPPKPIQIDGERLRIEWEINLDVGGEQEALITVTPASGGRRPRRRRFGLASRKLDAELDAWARECTRIDTDNELFQSVIAASMRDLQALLTPAPAGRIPAAGIPWFVAPFGRDSLLTSYESLLLDPKLARDTLIVLAGLQADADEPWRDAEPGKILHELRSGELAHSGLIPHTPYYGTVDATPLFVMLAAAYFRWTADTGTLAALRPALERALEWIDRHGDADGDGFVEYQRRSPAGLVNQGWKDSEDSILHADGTLAEGPIALVEVQGYVYFAKLRIAEAFEALGEPDRARDLRRQAQALREDFNEAFWNPEEGTFALALDGRKRQVASVTSNPGHCLYCGIVDPEKTVALAERLMAPDMWGGWGVRTLSTESPAYNPMSYHNGSVWPHDNAIIAAGLKRYGHADATERIASALFDVAAGSRDFRLAELYCGYERTGNAEIVPYPVACIPQAWAAAAPFMLLQAMLGITPHAPTKTLRVMQPNMPPWLRRAELQRLRVGGATVSLAFTRASGVTGFSLPHQEGEVTVTLAATAR